MGDYGDVGQYTITAKAILIDPIVGGGGKFEKIYRSTTPLVENHDSGARPNRLIRYRQAVAQPTTTTLTSVSRTTKQTAPVATKSLVVESDSSYEAAADELFSRDNIELLFAPMRWRRF